MKNIFIKVLPVLLISFYAVLLAIGCPSNSLEQSDTTSGVGTFSLKISGSEQQSRTIMPSDGTAQFGWYRIIFSRDGENVFDSVRPSNQFSAPVELPAGTDYTLKVFAYTIEPGKDTDLPAAYGESTNLSITAGQNVIEVIKLTAFGTTGADYGGMGIFSWSIGFTSDLYTSSILNLSEVKIGITPIAGTESPAYNYVLVAENPSVGQKRFTDTQTLGSGYYRVIIELNRANMHTVTWRETLHVYENMTSSYQNVFTNDHFLKNFYSVTFDAAGGSPSIPATSYFYDDSYEPSYPLRTGYSFDGWFKDGLGAAWNFSTQLTGDLDLVAKWTINKYTVTFDIGYDSGADPVSVTVDYGTKITKPQDPVRTKHEFMGWFKDAEYTEPWDFDDDTVPAQDISLHAKWEVIGLNVDRTSITLQQILGKDSLPGPQSIKITNTSSIPVTGITISISPANLFDLDNHTITTLAAEAEATFTVTPRNLGQGKHEATITINYTGAEELITIPVTFDVIPRFSGTAGANVSFNSNSLIVVPGALQGWYTRSISGTWLLNGRMASEGEDKVIDIPMSNVTITHSNFNNNNWNFIPGQGVANNGPGTTYGGWADLTGGIGRYQILVRRDNSNDRMFGNVDVEVFIPNNGVTVWFDRQGTSPPATPSTNANFQFVYMDGDFTPKYVMIGEHRMWRPAPAWFNGTNVENYPQSFTHTAGTARTVTRNGYFFFPPGNNLSIFIRIDAYASFQYIDESMVPLRYPILLGLDGIYYWKEGAEDHWSITGEDVRILEFIPQSPHNTSGAIKIRAYDPSAPGVVFEPATGGLDTQYPPIDKLQHYKSITEDINIDGEIVGTMTINAIDHTLNGQILTRVELSVTYSLDADFFENFLDTITCEGIPINKSNFTKDGDVYNATLPLPNQFIHGPLTMHTGFTFVTGD